MIEKIAKYWDDRSISFDDEHDTEDIERWISTLHELLGSDKNKSVLDLGTGTGFLANMTAKLGYSSCGVDISEEMMSYAVKHAKEAGSNAVFMYGNVLSLLFMDNTYDYIVNARLIWTLVEADKAIQEWQRVIKPGGKIFCFNRIKEGVGLTSGKANIYDDEELDKQLTIKSAGVIELMDLLERNGLVDVKVEKLLGLTRPDFDYDPWFVLAGTKPVI